MRPKCGVRSSSALPRASNGAQCRRRDRAQSSQRGSARRGDAALCSEKHAHFCSASIMASGPSGWAGAGVNHLLRFRPATTCGQAFGRQERRRATFTPTGDRASAGSMVRREVPVPPKATRLRRPRQSEERAYRGLRQCASPSRSPADRESKTHAWTGFHNGATIP
jgi:hypothetical protein